MRRTAFRFLAVSSGLLAAARGPVSPVTQVEAATRPQYGGTLRVELGSKTSTLGPAGPPARVPVGVSTGVLTSGSASLPETFGDLRARERLNALIYDRLVGLDLMGRLQPALAVSWEHDARNQLWRFKLRAGVKWHDGQPVTAAEVAAALDNVVPNHPWSQAGEDTVEIDAGSPRPDFPAELATSPDALVARKTGGEPGAPPAGTGPFRLGQWEPGRHAALIANEDYWGGRPYLDAVRVEMGASGRDRLVDFELDKADLVELDPPEARRAQQEGRKVRVSEPVDVLALVFNLLRPVARDRRAREAVALSIDRAAIQRVLLQGYGEAAGDLLPEWVSGFAFLFPTAPDLARARQLTAALGAPLSLKLGYDGDDALARQVAERVAVNGRDAGVRIEVSPLHSPSLGSSEGAVDAIIKRGRIEGPTLSLALAQSSRWFGLPAGATQEINPEAAYTDERRFLDEFTVVPLVEAPELVGLAPRVENWPAGRSTDWRLDNVWLAPKP